MQTPIVDRVANVTFNRLKYLKRAFGMVSENLLSLDTRDNTCLLQQHQEHLQDLQKELSDIHQEYMSAEHEDTGKFDSTFDILKEAYFKLSQQVRKLLRSEGTATPLPLIVTSKLVKLVKLPRLEIPTFDSSIFNLTTFWEQFDISIPSRFDLATAEKLAYLRDALKNGNAKPSIEGLSRSGEQYKEAVACLKDRYDRP